MNERLVTIGMMLESSGEVSQWDYDVLPGDVVVFPKSVEQEGRYTGQSRYATITLSEADMSTFAAGEPQLQDPEFWTRIRRFRASLQVRSFIRRDIAERTMQLREGTVPASGAGLDYVKRSIVEAFITAIVEDMPSECEQRHPRGARVVRDVEDFIDGVDTDCPVHIWELCSALRVSRRTLHRAFHDTLGIGPLAYLRLRRLSAAHRLLSTAPPETISVTQVALDLGFSDLGRFASYYHKVFKESPSQTRRTAFSAVRMRS